MSNKKIQDTVKNIFTEYLHKKKYRKTEERYTILREIYQFNGHFDVESMYIKMKNKKYRVSRATLYNTIELLLECNLIRKHQFGNNNAQYEKCYSNKQHDHLICTVCNSVIEFCDPRIQAIKNGIEETMSFKINRHALNFYGKCIDEEKCNKQKNN